MTYSQIRIKGRVIDEEKKPIELAEVILLDKDSSSMKNTFTDNAGQFTIEAVSGSYILEVRLLGATLYHKALQLESSIDVGTIHVQVSTRLKEVEIRFRQKLVDRKIDRLVFNVENSISATGGDAVDILKISPGIKVKETGITMIGKSGMSVMVDDRPIELSGEDLINFLRTLKAADIKNVEIITNPPSKYAAEGNSSNQTK